MAINDEVYIRIIADAAQSMKTMASFGAALAGLKIAYQAVTRVVGDLLSAYFEQEQAEAKLSAVLKSTGGAAGYTTEQMSRMAAEMQRVTTFGDETVMSAQAVMATFVRVGRDVFPQAIEAAANMSTVMGQDLQSSVVQLGKALNDPITGVTALRRVGVQLTEQQQASIKTFVAQGNILEAQKIILQELQTEFGGAARAMGETAYGATQKLTNAFGDLKEAIGGALARWATESGVLTSITSAFQEAAAALAGRGTTGLDKVNAEIDRVRAHITWIQTQLAHIPEGGLMAVIGGRGGLERDLERSIKDMDKLLIAQGEYTRGMTATERQRQTATDAAAATVQRELELEAQGQSIAEAWAKTETGKVAILQEQIQHWSSLIDLTDVQRAMVADILAALRAQLPVVEQITQKMAVIWTPEVKKFREASVVITEIKETFDESKKLVEDITAQSHRIAANSESGAIYTDIMNQNWRDMSGYIGVASANYDSLAAQQQKLKEGAEEYKRIWDKIGTTVIDSAWEIGEALTKGGDATRNVAEAFRQMGLDLLKDLPKMLLRAGLNQLALFPPTPASIATGLALVAASGLVALAGGAITGHSDKNKADEDAALAEVAANAGASTEPAPTAPVYVTNYYGSVITEADYDSRNYRANTRKARGY